MFPPTVEAPEAAAKPVETRPGRAKSAMNGKTNKQGRTVDLPAVVHLATVEEINEGLRYAIETNTTKKQDKFPGENEVAVKLVLSVTDVTCEETEGPGSSLRLKNTTYNEEFTLEELGIEQLRTLCKKIGCTGYSSLNKYTRCLFIAQRKNICEEIKQSTPSPG